MSRDVSEEAACVITGFAKIARPIMRRYMAAASCIASARTTIEVMRLHNLKAVPIPVKFAFQVPAKKYARISGFSKAECERMKATAANWRDDTPGGGGWSGHLLVLVENRWLLDPSIDQANSEEFRVPVSPKILVVDLDGQEGLNLRGPFAITLGFRLDNGDEGKLEYHGTRDRGYRKTDAWNDEGLPFLAMAIADKMLYGEPVPLAYRA